MNVKDIVWDNPGPTISEEDVASFVRQTGLAIPGQYAEFLTRVTNGGGPSVELMFPAERVRGGADALGVVYGIEHPKKHMDLLRSIENIGAATGDLTWTDRFFPFGYDESGGQLVISIREETKGEVLYIPHEEWQRPGSQGHRVARDLDAFFKSLQQDEF